MSAVILTQRQPAPARRAQVRQGRCLVGAQIDPIADRGQRSPLSRADWLVRDPHPSGTTPRTCARRSSRPPHASCMGSADETKGAASRFFLPRACHTRCQAVRTRAAPPLHRQRGSRCRCRRACLGAAPRRPSCCLTYSFSYSMGWCCGGRLCSSSGGNRRKSESQVGIHPVLPAPPSVFVRGVFVRGSLRQLVI